MYTRGGSLNLFSIFLALSLYFPRVKSNLLKSLSMSLNSS
ncbi:GlyGly-CTERM sorting domain-containing protein [Clostridium botulinum]|nr:GlyGly-CTERM sorting domain-containing protein [Clostridium botulinum]NFH84944.1 GlyGly-CTERM sorting domain-containing protein [Clostridium botulinum]NFI12946.1 GlyGly-CTERM sorting domain-containing protein [Clostridium botulinum]NFI16119.1 GlyGly-CTERM sorting domain-containing protein [Clostridium botulinum]NFO85947.1 GlyGly-CTERM sorting domain-containing protein [Clostridium botulinum]